MRPLLCRRFLVAVAACLVAVTCCEESAAIEMFTYFGDGSRIGLPNLEVPIEAYPGIPLRSDRLRARRRAARTGPGTTVRVGPGTPTGGVTIRTMPRLEQQPQQSPTAAARAVPRPATRGPGAR